MELLVLVLNRIELLDQLLIKLSNEDIRGATIISATGMASELADSENARMLGSLRILLKQSRPESKLIFIVLPQEKIQTAKDVIHAVVGNLSLPHTGILFTLPLSYVEGLREA